LGGLDWVFGWLNALGACAGGFPYGLAVSGSRGQAGRGRVGVAMLARAATPEERRGECVHLRAMAELRAGGRSGV
jgi:hypothetical protein